jgi:hypothetical protein
MNVTIKVTDDGGTLHLLDLYEFSAPKLTYQFADLRSASSSLAGFSSTFRIPATSGNVALFGPLQDPAASTDYLTKRKKPATVEVDTVPVFTGFMRLARVVVQRGETHEFEVTLFGEVASLAKALGDATLGDCDFSAYDHSLSLTNITSSWSDGLFSGDVVYPLVDYGVKMGTGPDSYRKIDTVDGALDLDHFKPWVKVKAVLDQVFQYAGWEYESTFLTSEPFTKLVMPWVNHAGERMASLENGADAAWGLLSDDTYTLTSTFTNPGWADETTPFYDPSAAVTAGVYTATSGGVHYVTVQMSVAADPTGSGTADIEWALFKGGAIIPSTTSAGTVDTTWTGATPMTYAIPLASGDNIQVKVRGTGDVTFIGDGSLAGAGCTVEVKAPGAYLTTDMNAAAPEVKAVDLIDDIARLFNLVLVPSREKANTLLIEPFDDFIASGDIVDWRGKLDTSKDYTVTPTAELQKKELVLTYLKDKDMLNEAVTGAVREDGERVYGEKVIRIEGNDYATGKEEVKLKVFAATPCAQLAGSIIVAPLFYDATGAPIKPKPRILYWGGLQTIGTEVAVTSGITDGTVPGSLVHSTANFVTAGVEAGDRVDNTTDSTFTFVTAVATSALLLADDIFTSGEAYEISRNGGWYLNEPSGTFRRNYYPYVGQFETPNSGLTDVDLAFGVDTPYHYTAHQTFNNLYYAYYQSYFTQLYAEEGRVLEAYFKLTTADILSFQFNDRVFVLGCEWRISKVSDYGVGTDESVKVELVKITSAARCRYVPVSIDLTQVVSFVDLESERSSGITDAAATNKLKDSTADFTTDGVAVGDIAYNTTDGTQAVVEAVDSATQLALSADIFTTGEDYVVRPVGGGNEACCEASGYRWDGTDCLGKKLPNIPPVGPGIPPVGGPVDGSGGGTDPTTISARLGTFPATRIGSLGGIRSGLVTGLHHRVGEDIDTAAFQGIRIGGSNATALHDGEDVIGGGWLRTGDPADQVGRGQAGRIVLVGEGAGASVGDTIPLYVQGRPDVTGCINIPEKSAAYLHVYVSGVVVNSGGSITSAGSIYVHTAVYRVTSGNVTLPSLPVNSALSSGSNPIKALRLDITQPATGLLELALEVHASGTTFTDTGQFTALVDYVLVRNVT